MHSNERGHESFGVLYIQIIEVVQLRFQEKKEEMPRMVEMGRFFFIFLFFLFIGNNKEIY